MSRRLKLLGLLLANTLVATLGPAIVEPTVYRLLPPAHTLTAALLKETLVSVLTASLIGFGMWRTWRSDSAKWSWLVTSLWFALGVVAVAGHGRVFGSLLPSASPTDEEMRSFYVFTILFVRGIAYSFGAYASSLVFLPRAIHKAE